MTTAAHPAPVNSKWRVLSVSLAGTTIEFYDFYIYATAAVLVFPKLFFPESDPTSATLQSLATFAIAFFARPIGSALFGHFGDRIGRKATLIASLLLMGLSTVAIGFLPTYHSIGLIAPLLLALCRLGQGLGLGGEWGGAVLVATENAPPGKRAWYGMFPQLGAPIGFVLSSAAFLLLTTTLTDAQFLSFGWRIPFILSFILVVMGLYVRLKITETPDFTRAQANNERVRVPMVTVFTRYPGRLLLGTLACVTTFALFYIMTVFALGWATAHLDYPRQDVLVLQMAAMGTFAVAIPLSAWYAGRRSARRAMIIATCTILTFSLVFAHLFVPGNAAMLFVFLALGLFLMGLTYGPLGTAMAELFPTAVRYTGASLAFNLAGILGGSLTPLFSTELAGNFGVASVGYYLGGAAVLTLVSLLLMEKSKFQDDTPPAEAPELVTASS